MSSDSKCVFVTVGSTKFDALVAAVLSNDVFESLKKTGFDRLVIQCGNSKVPLSPRIWNDEILLDTPINGISTSIWRFKKSLKDNYAAADLVIGHAGSGTIIEVLRMGRKLIAVPNETLLHNHQAELAEALDTSGYLIASPVSDLAEAIQQAMSKDFERFPEYDGSKFSRILDEEMGFI
ncbi:UDP-N-acetylglucosamine transferase subunit ALG13 {ECO:0000256/RuleBase:RU362128} {ECO:0000256/RuleBase:RU362128}; AltName: Full=Asparagine-linked glycosylation protein 13 {ECO:0000256/RuleBase:RU362128} [Serendipita indica DSM 11827]|uniref:UDP-N-acetylglucosamine transferase subunit ALG13 n=1 Tax=Serendipita indica (strain DSM 11827) TaxID=1109443 RepID=G4T6J5_SERID|nr:UDP-N-acetylglucosamine transferase subunit ALG13 {ECO:0000256/RuleBase:RU362128} {ECO:0000256/RuleBase:RU362128}; AltName: Full=Asparagine-linked glycosylation protein 13 {ECO:0000256/RuleBase:RU362128} [Serendipita indica DSM 11827]CCA66933.1 hypothetical protein PIIN_00771 [Serendipita indica DSM 11827]